MRLGSVWGRAVRQLAVPGSGLEADRFFGGVVFGCEKEAFMFADIGCVGVGCAQCAWFLLE